MPAQTTVASATYYGKGDTDPYRAWLLTDDYGEPYDLTDAVVTIDIAYTMPGGYYYSPYEKKVDGALCVVDPDQTADGNRGVVWWRPEEGDLDLAGTFSGRFFKTVDGRRQSISPLTYFPIIVTEGPGGVQS